jgi:beta-fructofuranosidase
MDTQTRLRIDVGDNVLSMSNDENEDAKPGEMKLFLHGPSIGRREQLGLVSDKIKSGSPFELSISYQNNKLVYAIDRKEIFTRQTDIPPAGLIKMNGFSRGLHIYDVISKGQFKPYKELVTREFMLDRATKSVAAAAEKVKGDPNRPAYHFQPPANWNNDPNGMLYYDGYYHMFYQHNPYADVWDWMHWGHARSKDLVHWEHLPIALWPSVERGERHCFSGSGFSTKDGKPILFYTSIGHELPEHWAAIPADDELIVWDKHPQNPLIVMEDHGGEMIDSWRDPFLFREDGVSYMVIGGHPRGKKGSIMMYKARNDDLTKWKYIGSPFEGEEKNWECPNFFKVEDKYVLIYSPHDQVEYYVGDLDFESFKFQKEHHGIIDNSQDWNYYAPNTLQLEDGRRLLFGWINNFKRDQGWQGAITLPRDLSLDEKGRLLQKPVDELRALRKTHTEIENANLAQMAQKIDVNTPQFEMIAHIADKGADKIGFRFNDENGKPIEISLTPTALYFGKEKLQVEPVLDDKIKKVHLFFDRTVIEIFVNDGRLCATKVVYPDLNSLNFEIFSGGNEITISKLDVWELKSIW